MISHKRKSILFLPAWYPDVNNSMLGIFVKRHALAIKENYEVSVLYVCGVKHLDGLLKFSGDTEELKTFTIYYRKPKNKNRISYAYEGLLYILATFYGYYRYLKINKRPDVFHVHVLTRTAILPFLMSFVGKIPYYITEHWSRYLPQDGRYKGALRKWFTRLVVRRSSGMSTVSLAMKKALQQHHLNVPNFPIISNVVDDLFYQASLKDRKRFFNFLHVSCFDDQSKNISGILNVFSTLEELGFQFSLTMVGDGIDFQMAKAFIRSKKIKNIVLTGALVGEKLVDEYEKADMLVMFSHFENQPCVILEAQACGLPVLATHVGGIPELVNEKYGVLVEAGNEDQLAMELRNILNGKYHFNSTAIREYAIANYSRHTVTEQFKFFYEAGGAI
jgi:glycosyltransferase involved in cell wall biosynthesis